MITPLFFQVVIDRQEESGKDDTRMKCNRSIQYCRLVPAVILLAVTSPVSAKEAESKTCPSQERIGFIDAFSKSEAIQRRFTKFPLKHTYIDTVDPAIGTEYFYSFDKIPNKNNNGGILPPDFNKKKGLRAFQINQNKNHFLLDVVDDNKTTEVVYHFSRTQDCWLLFWIEDKSS